VGVIQNAIFSLPASTPTLNYERTCIHHLHWRVMRKHNYSALWCLFLAFPFSRCRRTLACLYFGYSLFHVCCSRRGDGECPEPSPVCFAEHRQCPCSENRLRITPCMSSSPVVHDDAGEFVIEAITGYLCATITKQVDKIDQENVCLHTIKNEGNSAPRQSLIFS
jgi:hypothetical protein